MARGHYMNMSSVAWLRGTTVISDCYSRTVTLLQLTYTVQHSETDINSVVARSAIALFTGNWCFLLNGPSSTTSGQNISSILQPQRTNEL